jgi:hypothetical protein
MLPDGLVRFGRARLDLRDQLPQPLLQLVQPTVGDRRYREGGPGVRCVQPGEGVTGRQEIRFAEDNDVRLGGEIGPVRGRLAAQQIIGLLGVFGIQRNQVNQGAGALDVSVVNG